MWLASDAGATEVLISVNEYDDIISTFAQDAEFVLRYPEIPQVSAKDFEVWSHSIGKRLRKTATWYEGAITLHDAQIQSQLTVTYLQLITLGPRSWPRLGMPPNIEHDIIRSIEAGIHAEAWNLLRCGELVGHLISRESGEITIDIDPWVKANETRERPSIRTQGHLEEYEGISVEKALFQFNNWLLQPNRHTITNSLPTIREEFPLAQAALIAA
jgi:hypothetical protein